MKKIPSYPKITTKTNITVTQTQNININSPKSFGITGFSGTKKLFKLQNNSTQKQQNSEIKNHNSKSKGKIGIARKNKNQLDSRRQSSGMLSKPSRMSESKKEISRDQGQTAANKEEIKRLEEKLKELEKKIDNLKATNKRKKQLSSQRSHSKVKDSTPSTVIDSKSSINNLSKKHQVSSKILKKSQSDKAIIKPIIPIQKTPQNKQEDSDVIHKFVTQVTRSQGQNIKHHLYDKFPKPKTDHQICYYIQGVVESLTKNYLLSFKEHLIQSIQTIKFLQHIRKPSLKELQKHSIVLPPSKFKYSVILDLDETLIHCNETLSAPHDVTLKIKFPTGEKIDAGVNIRPFAKELLKELSSFCEIIVFTASHECYANVVLDYLDPKRQLISHRLFRCHCWQTQEGIYIKDLRVIKNRQMQNIVLVDNAAYSYFYQLQNGIPIVPFYDDSQDQELVHLLRYLREIIEIKQSKESNLSLQQINQSYFQLDRYHLYESIEVLANKLYRGTIVRHKQ